MARSIEGVDELKKAIALMGVAAGNRAIRRAMNRAMRPTVRKLRMRAPQGTEAHRTYKGRLVRGGFLKRSIKSSTRIGRDKNKIFGSIRPDSEAWYGSLLEHGWRPSKRGAKVRRASRRGALSDDQLKALGDNRAKIQGNRWWSRAIEGEDERILQALSDEILDQLAKEWSK